MGNIMASKKVNWDHLYAVIDSIPPGYWMSYGDVCEASGLTRTSAKAVGQYLAKASSVPKQIHRVLRNDGSIPGSWKGEIGTAENCQTKLEAEGLTFDHHHRANSMRRYAPTDKN